MFSACGIPRFFFIYRYTAWDDTQAVSFLFTFVFVSVQIVRYTPSTIYSSSLVSINVEINSNAHHILLNTMSSFSRMVVARSSANPMALTKQDSFDF